MLSLIAHAIHRDGRHSDVTCQFGAKGGSIGRDAKCNLVLPDPDRLISRLQARIIHTGRQYVVGNASTSNPLYVNGVELSPGSNQAIFLGDELRAGSYVITVAGLTDMALEPNDLSSDQDPLKTPNAVEQPAQLSQTDLGSEVDPLVALSADGQPDSTSVNSFADLLPDTTSINKNSIPAEPNPKGVNPSSVPPSDAAVAKLPLEQPADPQELLKTVAPNELSAAQRQQLEIPLATEVRSNSVVGAVLVSKETDTSDNFEVQVPLSVPVIPSKVAKGNMENQLSENWTPPLSKLAGDPFADLMGPPVESHIARVSVSRKVVPRTAHIPDNFNPFATSGIAHRNLSDPLTPLGRNDQGLPDIIPERTIDSIYAPGVESPSTLAIDPLNQSVEHAFKVEQSVDPLKLFSGDERGVGMLLKNDQINKAKSISDHTLEMASFFRVATAKPDTASREQAAVTGSDIPHVHKQLPADRSLQKASLHKENPIATAMANLQTVDTELSEPSRPVPQGYPVPQSEPLNNQEPSTIEPTSSAVDFDKQTWNPTDTTSPTMQDLMSAFKRGAGLQDWTEQLITPELMETMGHMLQAVAQGMVALLASRATVKQEIHLSVTLINPKSNNPLKFLPDGHTALLQMLGSRIPGFMAPIDAIEEAFENLIIHETAIVAGTQATIESLFRRFGPDLIETQNPRNGVGEKIFNTLHHARLWNAYKNRYKTIEDEVKDDFFKRLGLDFYDAYNMEYKNHAFDRKLSPVDVKSEV